MTLHKLVSKGIQEAISVLEGGRKQSMDAYTIGSTVQPVVEVNKGIVKRLVIPATAGNSAYTITVPTGKIWKICYGCIYLDTDATVANRYIALQIIDSLATAGDNVNIGASSAVTANLTSIFSINHTDLSTQSLDAGMMCNYDFVRGGDILNFYIAAGVAGDSYRGWIKVLEYEVAS